MSVSNRNMPTVQDLVQIKEVLIKRDELLQKKEKVDGEIKILKERKAALEYFNSLKNQPVRTDAENAKIVKGLVANLTKTKTALQKKEGSVDLLSRTELLKAQSESFDANPADTIDVEYLRFRVDGLTKELIAFLCPPKK